MSDHFDVINELIGKTFSEVRGASGDDEMLFIGEQSFRFYHEQDCCESVSIEEIIGDVSDLIGTPILVAEERTREDECTSESGTWTFYEFRTIKGSVTVRWLGTSNGYYSESVSFVEVKS